MSKLLKQLGFAGLVIVAGASMPAFAAAAGGVATVGNSGLCELIGQMQGVFKILRTLAFVGAAFLIAQWAWGYIKAGDVKMDELKDKGTALLVGFVLLFGIGFLLQFLSSSAGLSTMGCDNLITGWNQ